MFHKVLIVGIHGLVEQRVGVGLSVEGNEVVDLFAGADETNGQAKFARDGNDDAAFGGAIELGENDAGDTDAGGELASLGQTVLSRGGVENEQDVVRRAGNNFGGGALHFFEFLHEIGFGVQAAGGVDDDGVGGTRFGCGHGVEDHGGGIGAGLLLDDFHTIALRPNFELFDGGGAEGVRGTEDDAASILAQTICELANTRGFAGAIYT